MTTASQLTRKTRTVPPMASRHFWFIADTIKSRVEELEGGREYDEGERADRLTELTQLALAFASGLRQSNGNFDRERFLAACGVVANA